MTMRWLLSVGVMILLAAGGARAQQEGGVGAKFWPFVEPPPGMDLEIDVANKKLFLRTKGIKDPYVITYKDKDSGKVERFNAWAEEIIWNDAIEFAEASGNIKIENQLYTIMARRVTYDRRSGQVISPDVTVVIERLADGFTNFIKAKRVDIRMGDKGGVNSIKFNEIIESRYHISQGETSNLMGTKDLLSERKSSPPAPPAAPVTGQPPAPMSPDVPRKAVGPDL